MAFFFFIVFEYDTKQGNNKHGANDNDDGPEQPTKEGKGQFIGNKKNDGDNKGVQRFPRKTPPLWKKMVQTEKYTTIKNHKYAANPIHEAPPLFDVEYNVPQSEVPCQERRRGMNAAGQLITSFASVARVNSLLRSRHSAPLALTLYFGRLRPLPAAHHVYDHTGRIGI
ncbi:MAG: hypothetical protein GY765_34925 [bacterium]|nr:hypothetical protein [bacterium]